MTRLPARILPFLALAASCAASVLAPSSASAATINVDSSSNEPAASCGSVAAPCETLADAVARAESGDTLRVAPGDYAGTTIDRRVRLIGVQSGVSGTSRGLDANRTSTIRSTLVLQAAVAVDGFEFAGIATGPALVVETPRAGEGTGGSSIVNNTFSGVTSGSIITVLARTTALEISDNLLVGEPGSTGIGMRLDGSLIPDGQRGVRIERNELRALRAAAIDARGTPGLVISANTISDSASLLALADTDSTTSEQLRVSDNVGTDFTGPALHLGGGVRSVEVTGNRFAGGVDAALRISDARGTGASSGIELRGNDVSRFAFGIHATGGAYEGTLLARGNRIVAISLGGSAVHSTLSKGSVDASRNWWGRNAGPASGTSGTSLTVSEPLRLVGVEAPAAIFVGGSGVVTVRLVGPVGGAAEPAARGFAVAFTSTSARLDAASVAVSGGVASTLITAGDAPGSTTTTVTLDEERVTATTKMQSLGSDLATGPAEPTTAATQAAGFLASTTFDARSFARAVRVGITQVVTTNRLASVRASFFVSHRDARALGLRPRTSPTHQLFLVGTALTRARAGTRNLTVSLSPRARSALARSNRRIEVRAYTRFRSTQGQQRVFWTRIVLPSKLR